MPFTPLTGLWSLLWVTRQVPPWCGAGTVHHSRAHEFTPVIGGVRITHLWLSLSLSLCYLLVMCLSILIYNCFYPVLVFYTFPTSNTLYLTINETNTCKNNIPCWWLKLYKNRYFWLIQNVVYYYSTHSTVNLSHRTVNAWLNIRTQEQILQENGAF